MIKKFLHLIFFVTAFFAGVVGAHAQERAYKGEISYGQPQTLRRDGMLIINMEADVSDLVLGKQQMVVLTPKLRFHEDGDTYTYVFSPVAVAGKVRYTVYRRNEQFGHIKGYESEVVIRRFNRRKQTLPLRLTLPYEEWMSSAELVVIEEVSGCSTCCVSASEQVVLQGITAQMGPAPEFMLSMIVPPVERVKRRSETYSASINFPQGGTVLRRDFMGNAASLDEIDRIIGGARSDENITVREITVTGYASPEGYFYNNMDLSEKRARALVNYLYERHDLRRDAVDFFWRGEDWEGLRRAVAESDIYDKDRVLSIIDNTPDPGERKMRLRSLSQGETYRYLQDFYFPSFRRNDYTITYIARPFDVAEARRIIKVRPRQLSMNEMFLVATTYSPDSEEFREVFDIAARHFPLDEISNTNAGAVDIDNGAMDAGIKRLSGINRREAWNNMGVGYAKKGDYVLAEQYFRRAAAAGDATAQDNLAQLLRWLGK